MTELLKVDHLVVEFAQRGWRRPAFRAVDNVSFSIGPVETVGLVGESGSGKSTIGRAILGLTNPASGTVDFDGVDLTRLRSRSQKKAVTSNLQAVFQDPFSSLSPARTIAENLTEPLLTRGDVGRKEALAIATQMLGRVGVDPRSMTRYPFEFSGGQRQRVAIARALTVSPKLVVCDESVSSLDVSTQAQVLNLLRELQSRLGVSYLFIAHNLDVVSNISDRVLVLYRGRAMESGPSEQVHGQPLHPYTRALLSASPVADPVRQRQRRLIRASETRVTTAAASVAPVEGCPFAPRCVFASDVCWTDRPRDTGVERSVVACHLYDSESRHPRAGEGVPTASRSGTL